MTIKTTINHIAIALFLIALSNLLFASDVVPRCYVQAMNGSDPMISENVDLSQYQPVDRRINVRFIEYADPAVEFLTDEQFWQDRLEVVNNIFSQAELNFVFEVFSQRELDIDEYANAFEDCNVPPID